jgi:hypothetical protein
VISRRIALAIVALGAAVPAPASASVSVTTFTVTPSTLAADASPNVTVNAKFSYSDGSDTAKTATLVLAPGLLANPQAVTATCTQTELDSNSCPSASQIGTGSLVASTFLGNLTAAASLYLMPAATSSQIAQVGLIGSAAGQTITGQAAITAATNPVSLKLALSNIPQQAGGFSIQLLQIQLTIDGTVDGQPFTRNPTSCSSLASKLSVTTYESSTPVAASSSFTPTGCSALAYAPNFSASAKRDTTDNGVAVTVTGTEGATGSATRNLSVTLPPSLVLNSAVVSAAQASGCATSTLSGCPQVGTVSATIPYLAKALVGRVYFVGRGTTELPGLYMRFGQPVPFKTFSRGASTSSGTTETFTSLPDAPFTRLTVKLSGGTSSLFTNGTLCTTPGSAKATFTPWSGAAAVAKTATLACS